MFRLADSTRARSSIAIPGAFRQPWAIVTAFSLFYFVDVCIRAHDKFLWYDEVFTKYFCQISGTRALLHALASGIDFNPPLFYWLTEAARFAFGQGHLGIRIPEILGFWIFCLCLFRFVSRRAGLVAGSLAMLLPVVTQAYFWAYEARPHALVLAFCGLALVTWQLAEESGRHERRWLLVFGFALFGAMMMHCFAVVLVAPFAIVEVYRDWRLKQVDWTAWSVFVIPPAVAAYLYIPLLHSYRELTRGNTLLENSAAGWTRFEHFYWFLFQPCILVIVAAAVFFAVDVSGRSSRNQRSRIAAAPSVLVTQEVLLGVGFVLLPLFGVALGKIVHAPFFNRYYLSSLAGICIIAGFGAGLRTDAKRIGVALTLVIALTAGANFGRLALAKARGEGELLILPDSVEEMETTPGEPLRHHPLLASFTGTQAIAVLDPFDFIYLVENAPAALKQQLYFTSETKTDFTFGGFTRFLENTPVHFHKPLTIEEFAHEQPDGAMYGKVSRLERLVLGMEHGCHIETLKVQTGHFLASCTKTAEKESNSRK